MLQKLDSIFFSFQSALEDKHEELLAEKGRQERLAASITDQMCAEAQVSQPSFREISCSFSQRNCGICIRFTGTFAAFWSSVCRGANGSRGPMCIFGFFIINGRNHHRRQ